MCRKLIISLYFMWFLSVVCLPHRNACFKMRFNWILCSFSLLFHDSFMNFMKVLLFLFFFSSVLFIFIGMPLNDQFVCIASCVNAMSWQLKIALISLVNHFVLYFSFSYNRFFYDFICRFSCISWTLILTLMFNLFQYESAEKKRNWKKNGSFNINSSTSGTLRWTTKLKIFSAFFSQQFFFLQYFWFHFFYI